MPSKLERWDTLGTSRDILVWRGGWQKALSLVKGKRGELTTGGPRTSWKFRICHRETCHLVQDCIDKAAGVTMSHDTTLFFSIVYFVFMLFKRSCNKIISSTNFNYNLLNAIGLDIGLNDEEERQKLIAQVLERQNTLEGEFTCFIHLWVFCLHLLLVCLDRAPLYS